MTRMLASLVLLPALAAQAQDAPKTKVEIGFEERVRSEDWDNIIDHNDAKVDYRSHYRFRTRLWATADFGKDLQVSAGLVNENRKTTRPENYVYNGREVFFETLYADWKFAPGWSVRAGRQNLMKGEGFVIMDGSSGDGSRSVGFDAVDLAYAWGKSKMEFLVISDPQRNLRLPMANKITVPAEMIRSNEWDESALGAYYTAQEWTGATLEAYWIFKQEKNDYRPAANALFRPDRRFHTLGARGVEEFSQGWTASAEFALQRGTQDDAPGKPGTSRDVRAWGGYARLRKTFDAPWKPKVSVGFTGLSGQDPHSNAVTAWDPVFSRWPKWSELYIYSQVPEAGVAYWTNTAMGEVEARCSPSKRLDLRATYYFMNALEAPATAGPVLGTGKKRGDLWQVRADVVLASSLKGHALYEHLTPGSFYAGRDGGHFLRFELAYTFKKVF